MARLHIGVAEGAVKLVIEFASLIRDTGILVGGVITGDPEAIQAVGNFMEVCADVFSQNMQVQKVYEKANINPVGNTERQLAYAMQKNPQLQEEYMQALSPIAEDNMAKMTALKQLFEESIEELRALPPEDRAEAIGQIIGYALATIFGLDIMVAGKILQAGTKVASGLKKGFSGVKWERRTKEISEAVGNITERTSQQVRNVLDNTLSPELAMAGGSGIKLEASEVAKG